ncbi:cytochrome b/b6 domain-containing protein [Propionivibrio sp.]|uniref:cytochrome b/b6 domain-containing protein n=1 Tax=Propionivibrio sp. TaxID=2212460 RepID=UPI002617AB43|nr:cytochrome b/b6 domain-containing protein [Propionivibrio sp.]
MSIKRIKLWDLPTRLFHWLLVVFVSAAVITGNIGGGAMDWHGRIGLVILGLVVFRLVWGLVGSSHARFASFFPTPATLRAYLRGQWQGVGHNPLGAFSVFGLLTLIALQLVTGLFSNDDIAFRGPLYDLISKDLSDRLSGFHGLTSNALIALIILHLCAIAFYAHVKKDNLVKPMITGWKDVEQGESATGGGAIAFIVALLIALAAVYVGSGAWLPAPPPPAAAQTTPTW